MGWKTRPTHGSVGPVSRLNFFPWGPRAEHTLAGCKPTTVASVPVYGVKKECECTL
jgi:hypothetical protein